MIKRKALFYSSLKELSSRSWSRHLEDFDITSGLVWNKQLQPAIAVDVVGGKCADQSSLVHNLVLFVFKFGGVPCGSQEICGTVVIACH